MHFSFSSTDLVLKAAGGVTKFDNVVSECWNRLHDTGQLRYKLQPSLVRFTAGPSTARILILVSNGYSLTQCSLIQSNPNRFLLRRTPIAPTSLDEPLTGFSFTRVKSNEVICTLAETNTKQDPCTLLVNISPFTPLHCLFVPNPENLYNQYLRRSALKSAIKCILLSDNHRMCMGFNSLLAHASVNHLHFHLWESPDYLWTMCTELLPKRNLQNYLEVRGHPVDNFARELTSLEDLENFVDSIWRVVEQCQILRIAHNLFLARGKNTGFLRAIIWPRRSVYTAKSLGPTDANSSANTDGYNIAVAELAGMFVVASDNVAEQLAQHQGLLSALEDEKLPSDVTSRLVNELCGDTVM
ncbi:GDP-D-glucose phosphorylase 1 [Fasciola gigantica]|uniref:GDP-D-glucose phosphorylase 1 n=1 Tax=Fasciola gigantica TaxID=46835 RepID=A0A504YN87_FASGI|nr:GDP-D-glucose phosphorylase 1 [Fasciola gigantica]